MRCPKCGFISFDIVESCVKCGKNITKPAEELLGTVAGVTPPSFLRFSGEAAPEASEETAAVETEEPLDLGTESEDTEVDFSLDDESSAAPEVEVDLGAGEEEVPEINLGEETGEEVPEIDLGGGETPEESPEAELDLGIAEEPSQEEAAIGISDLAPSEAAEEVPVAEEPTESGHGLESLEVDGIDLETTPDITDSGNVAPSVKTGTALDDFDVDLGDLVSSKD